jgi:hypothetical protein
MCGRWMEKKGNVKLGAGFMPDIAKNVEVER